jgi:HSP20 family molecular chaperone IbpA
VTAKPKPCPSSKLELKENGENGWIAKLALPGINPSNVSVHFDDSTLYVVARNGHRRFTQSVLLPESADLANISARCESGFLTVTIPNAKPTEEDLKKAAEAEKKEIEKAKEAEKNLQLFLKKLTGPTLSTTEDETHITNTFDFGESINKDDIDIEVYKGVLSVHVKVVNEHCQYSFKKSITLPENVKEEEITAVFEASALRVSYPKSIAKKPFKVLISATQPVVSVAKPEEVKQDSSVSALEETSTSTTVSETATTTATATETTNAATVADFEIVDGAEEDQ